MALRAFQVMAEEAQEVHGKFSCSIGLSLVAGCEPKVLFPQFARDVARLGDVVGALAHAGKRRVALPVGPELCQVLLVQLFHRAPRTVIR